jgi:chromosome segregation ATPase
MLNQPGQYDLFFRRKMSPLISPLSSSKSTDTPSHMLDASSDELTAAATDKTRATSTPKKPAAVTPLTAKAALQMSAMTKPITEGTPRNQYSRKGHLANATVDTLVHFNKVKELECRLEEGKTLLAITRSQLNDRNKKIEKLQLKVDDVNESKKQLVKHVSQRTAQIAELKQKTDQRIAELDKAVSAGQTKLGKKATRLQAAQTKVRKLEAERKTVTEGAEELEKLKKGLEHFKKNSKRKDETLTRNHHEMARLKRTLQSQRERVNEATNQIVTLSEEVVSLRTENQRAKLSKAELQKKVFELEDANGQLTRENATLKKQDMPFSPSGQHFFLEDSNEDKTEALIGMCDQLMTHLQDFSKSPQHTPKGSLDEINETTTTSDDTNDKAT